MEIFPSGSNCEYDSIGSDNGSAQSMRQAIIWSNNVLINTFYTAYIVLYW